jgi:hypothetical protein
MRDKSIMKIVANSIALSPLFEQASLISIYIHIYRLYLATLAPTTTKVDFHGGFPYKKYYKEYKKEGN